MNLKENWKNIMSKSQKLTFSEIKAYKNTIFFLIVVDIFGLYWYLGLEKLASALLMVLLGFLGFLLYLERDAPGQPKPIKKKHKKIHNRSKRGDNKMDGNDVDNSYEEESGSFGDFNLGIDSESYEKRLNDALGTW